jgi:hypothetical protein
MTQRWKVLLGGGVVVAAGLVGIAAVRPQPVAATPVVTVYASPT